MSLRAVRHAQEIAPDQTNPEGAQDACPTCGRTCSNEQAKPKRAPVNATRRRLADVAAAELAEVFGADRGTWQTWADRLGISRQVARRFAETGGARVAVGDILAAEREKAIAYFRSLIKRLQGLDAADDLPSSIHATLHEARLELADVDRVLVPGVELTDAQLERIEKEAEEAENATARIRKHAQAMRLKRAAKEA